MIHWLSRCIPGLSALCLITLLVFAFSGVGPPPQLQRPFSRSGQYGAQLQDNFDMLPLDLRPSQKVFIFYTLLVHTDTALFALRLLFSIIVVKRKIRSTLLRRPDIPSGFYSEGILQPRDAQELELRSAQSDQNVDKLEQSSSAHEVVHAIILPNYQEDIGTLRMTLSVLAAHPRAVTQYKIFLAMEQKEGKAAEKASLLTSSFGSRFLSIHTTFHPSGLQGEIAGKSSNVAFAAREIFRQHRMEFNKIDTIITVIDCNDPPTYTMEGASEKLTLSPADTHLLQDYFTEIRRLHLANSERSRAFYVSPIVFDRNSQETNVLVRVADILWGGAGLAGYLPFASVHIPTSVYSLPIELAEDVGGWDGDPTAIGEDMHMLLKCYFNSGNRIITTPIYSPASQCNISPEYSQHWRKSINAISGRYQQALRHMWGSLDTGYAVRCAVKTGILRFSHLPLFHLLWEAHFVPVHFVILLLGSTFYSVTTPTPMIPSAILWTLWVTAVIRNISFLLMQVVFTVYDDYHRLCVNARAQDMRRAGILETEFSFRKHFTWSCLLERISIPVVAALYGAVPALHAQFCHFWTERLVYTVTRKPVFLPPV